MQFWLLCFSHNIVNRVPSTRYWHYVECTCRFLSFVHWLEWYIRMCVKVNKNASYNAVHTHTEDNDIQNSTGRHPDTLAVRTSNKLIEAIKSERQRALLKPPLPAASDLYPSFFFISCIYEFISPSIHCFLIHTSFPLPPHQIHCSASHPSLLLWVWYLASGQAQRLGSTLCVYLAQ